MSPSKLGYVVLSAVLVALATTCDAQQSAWTNHDVVGHQSGFSANPADLWYPFDGTTEWVIRPNGVPMPVDPAKKIRQPLSSDSTSPAKSAPKTISTVGTGWQAPVTPAMPSGVWDMPENGPPTRQPFAKTGPVRMPEQSPVDADSCSKTKPDPAHIPQSSKPSAHWTKGAGDTITSGTETIAGAWNWLRMETREVVEKTLGPVDRLALRPKCPDCGRRHIRRRH